nr:PREDICTED: uncharacterized protein LOC100882155 isoform X2 [Megachile rotundata]
MTNTDEQKNENEKQDTVCNWIMSLKMKTLLKVFLYTVVGPLLLYCLFFSLSHYQEHLIRIHAKVFEKKEGNPQYFIYAKSNDTEYLKHVFIVLERLGFKRTYNSSSWDLLWAHDYPFRVLSSNLNKLQAHQRVNHFPGCGYITNKVDLSTTEGRYILPAFKIPEQQDEFLEYAKKYPEKMFVEKSNDHRGISVKNVDNINITATGSFVQEFIQRPFLVDGYKFDIGVYTVITSVDPLRVYVYKGYIKEAMKRFGNGRNFFELVRIDFALDEDLNVYTMEANMSPNLSSAHYPPNQLLYEQVIYNLFALVGVGQRIRKDSLKIRNEMERQMEVADKNLMVLPELCTECDDCFRVECQLCGPCFTPETKLILSQSYLEHQNKMDFQRIFPPLITKDMVLKDYTLRNQLLIRWYQGKCEVDHSWCS